MKNFVKAIVGLDLTEMDEILISKVSKMVDFLGIKKIYFTHVAKDLTLPDEIKEHFPDLASSTDEAIRAEVKNLIQKANFPTGIDIDILVEEGKPMDTLCRWAKIKDVDLIIMGRKEELEGSGSLAKNMAHRAPCSVLFFTEKSGLELPKKVLIPMDFSDHSIMTMQFAERIAKEQNCEIVGLHIYSIPTGYYKTGKSHEEFAEIMETHAKNDYKKFIEKHDFKAFECIYKLKDDGNEGRFIIQQAKEIGADLILMGSRGRTPSAAVLLGSIAEKLVNINNMVPMLIFKKKGENMSFLDALLKL